VAVVHCAPLVLPIDGEPIENGAVAIEGTHVVAVGTRADVVTPGARVRDWRGVLTPGLVNAHTHLQYTDFADLATAGMPFAVWIRTLTERRYTWTPPQWQESVRRGVHEALRTGTTCVADVVTDVATLPVLARSGLAGVAYVEVVGVESYKWPLASEELLAKLANAPSGIDLGVSPHALYSLGTEAITGSLDVARERGLRLHPHLAETDHEDEYVRCGTGPIAEFGQSRGLTYELLGAGTGRSPVAYADELGMLGSDVHVAHGVHTSAEDRALLRERGTAVALCPRSNDVLGAGTPPVADYLAESSPIAVGTDSRASSPSLDLLEEVRVLHGLAMSQGASREGLARRLVAEATSGGACALGRDDVGRIAKGARADLAVFDVPDGEPYESLVSHGPGRCVATVLGGRLVHRRS